MDFIEYILKEMKKQNITAYKVCKDLNMSQQTFSNWKKGKIPAIDKAMEIIIYLGLSADEIYGIKENKLTKNEKELLEAYRRADERSKKAILSNAEILAPEQKEKSLDSKTG